jgi:uncharacterized caspase-like protein
MLRTGLSLIPTGTLLSLAALLAAAPCGAGAPKASGGPNTPGVQRRVALVIGNADYVSVGALKNPINDARDVCRELGGLGFRTYCYYDVKTRIELRALIQDFVESLDASTVSFTYYAGHAIQVNGENYLVPTGAQLQGAQSLVGESVSLAYIMRELGKAPDLLNVVILDACRNNPLPASDVQAAQGLAPITEVPDSTMVLYATAADEMALDGNGRNGIMTKYLLANLRETGTIDDLFKQVSLGVQKDTQELGHPQKPALYTNFSGQYCLVRCTDLEVLQAQRRDAEQEIADLQARVAAGDRGASKQLAEVQTANAKLLELISKKDEEARKAAQAQNEKQKQSFVPPAF